MTFNKPAAKWTEALPLGNGKIAAMIFGGVKSERIALNDSTLWSGYPKDFTDEKCAKALKTARSLIFEKKYKEAERFIEQNLRGDYSEAYLPLGDLIIKTSRKASSDYKRRLDLENGVFSAECKGFSATAFLSHPDNALYYNAVFDKKTRAEIKLSSKLKCAVHTDGDDVFLLGQAPDHVDPNYLRRSKPVHYDAGLGMAFGCSVRVLTDGKRTPKKSGFLVENATFLTLILTTDTGFSGFDKMPDTNVSDCKTRLSEKINSACSDFREALSSHISDFSQIMTRQSLKIADGEGDVEKLLKQARLGERNAELANICYDLGKYLIASGSRDFQPLNLQGQWNEDVCPPWSSNLTVNINLQMNYWGAAACGLNESLVPYYNALSEMAVTGKRTAKINFGAERGFCVNHNVDIWRMTTPVQGAPQYMFAPLMGVWLANETAASTITETGSLSGEMLKITEEACEFILAYLSNHNGKLVSCPSTSPEAWFSYNGQNCDVAENSACDKGIIEECFKNCLCYSQNEVLKLRVKAAEEKLFGYAFGERGLKEWGCGFDCAERGHRHFSPLYALYPGTTVRYYGDGKTLDGFRKLFEDRINAASNHIGWSAAWAAALSATLHDPDGAEQRLYGMLKRAVYPNLFAFHPPSYFQIDGNLGFVAAVNAMLFYEENGAVELLPALPKNWTNGEVRNHKIHGITLSIKWQNGKIISAIASKPIKVFPANISDQAELVNVEILI